MRPRWIPRLTGSKRIRRLCRRWLPQQRRLEGLFRESGPGECLIKEDNPEMQDALLAYSHAKMQEEGILLSGAAEDGRYGMMTLERWQAFFEDMVEAGTLPEDLDWKKAFDLSYIQSVYAD